MADVALTLPDVASLQAATALLADLKAAAPQDVITLDAAAVTSMSTPFVLTLISATRSRGDDAPPIRVENAPAAFLDSFSDLGMFNELMKMEFPV
ncbi:MAG: STAS domain-containing protein [Pseudomonadota bacterium]